MVKALFDSNILIDYLSGLEAARDELERHDDPAISAVTWIEVLVGTPDDRQEAVRSFLETFHIVALDQRVALEAVRARRRYRMKLPDAVIWAAAKVEGRLLITRNAKDFPADDPGVRTPYQVSWPQNTGGRP